MEEKGFRRWRGLLHGLLTAAVRLLFLLSACSVVASAREVGANAYPGVQLLVHNDQVVMDNGIVEVTFSNPGGDVTGIKFNGIDNLLEPRNRETNRGYWDIVWNRPGEPSTYMRIEGTTFKVVANTDDVVEVSFVGRWSNSSDSHLAPLIVDKRFVVRRGSSGLYGYAIFEHPKGWPDLDVGEARIVFKLNGQKFHYMAISDERQRVMPTAEDRASGRVLDYKEAVLLTDPSNSELEGQVDDKYQYSCENQDNKVHGWISSDPLVGFWMITPSHESHTAGPVKQDLTSHVGPTTLNVFYSNHYAGRDVYMSFRNGEAWKKVYGPFMVYVNSGSPEEDESKLWVDAKGQMLTETISWPYDFIHSEDYPSAAERGTVGGQLSVRDRYVKNSDMLADSAYVGLAAPGEVGSWQTNTKGYQFWTQADNNGSFEIRNVRPGVYGLYAWVPGFIGDYRYHMNITVKPGSDMELSALVFSPPRSGPTLWEIGIPDRTAAEFYVPRPYPGLMNKVFKNDTGERFRQYGLWERYTDLYPKDDLVYTVGIDNYRRDWFFAHVTRNIGNSTYVPTTWRIDFNLQNVDFRGIYRLQMAVASATQSRISIRINDPNEQPHSSTGRFGYDNAIARHGIHGLYWRFGFDVPGSRLHRGTNSIYLAQSRTARTPFEGVMYDYIRFEGPPRTH
ncbi:rhamnogalacturonate lyase-like [Rhodamnia argentea]|uniref:rhamnogalacturonan endolyase n=1 Tax=Rhodamnia argentea TaxID=178133 RepID=A0A8B8QN76_9MYRT|nr:rhamnogalacturonate lyase-like [Rhodamnia argentea]